MIQYNEYYPFGLQTAQSWTRDGNKNEYLYNAGNELNSNSQWYETFFRGYDPALGKFLQVDPKADKYASATTYNYAFNNPVVLNDPMGDDAYNRAHGLDWWRYNQNGSPRSQGMQDAGGGYVQNPTMFGSGFASTKGLSSFINYALNHSTNGGTWSANGSYSFFSSSGDAYNSAVGSDGPQIYNTYCACMVNAFDVLAINPAIQNKDLRARAQTAVNIYKTREQLYSIGIEPLQNSELISGATRYIETLGLMLSATGGNRGSKAPLRSLYQIRWDERKL